MRQQRRIGVFEGGESAEQYAKAHGHKEQIREIAALATERQPIGRESDGNPRNDECELQPLSPGSQHRWKTHFENLEARIRQRESADPGGPDEQQDRPDSRHRDRTQCRAVRSLRCFQARRKQPGRENREQCQG